jgi:hypothetical protein
MEVNNYFLIFVIIAVMLLVGFSGCIGNDRRNEEVAPTAIFNLIPGDILNASSNQTIAILTHQSGDEIKYSEIKKFSISNDTNYVGSTFYTLSFDVEQSNLHVMMTKGDNIDDPDIFEVGEVIYFQESGGNWNATNDFWVKAVHTSSSTLLIESVDLK